MSDPDVIGLIFNQDFNFQGWDSRVNFRISIHSKSISVAYHSLLEAFGNFNPWNSDKSGMGQNQQIITYSK